MSLRAYDEVEFDALCSRAAHLIQIVVLLFVALILCAVMASVLIVHEINGYASHIQIVKYNL